MTVGVGVQVAGWIVEKLSGFPREWHDRGRLKDWERGHADPLGDVWCVTPPTGSGWQLWKPGSPYSVVGHGGFPYCNVDPVEVSYVGTDDGRGVVGARLADVESWLRPWVEAVTCGRVAEMVEGLVWYGSDDSLCEYTIYARVA